MKDTSPLMFFPQAHNLGLIIRKQQINLTLGHILINTFPPLLRCHGSEKQGRQKSESGEAMAVLCKIVS